jgi:hypothetical protein
MFVVYNFSAPNYKPRYFETERGAKIAQGRNNNNPAKMKCGVLSLKSFNELFADKRVTVKNLITGVMVEIAESDRNTCNDPSQERYFTM